MHQAVLWVGDVNEAIQSAFAPHGLRLDVSGGAREASEAVRQAEPAFVIFARWSRACARLIARWRDAGRDMPVLVGVQPEVSECRAALDAGATDYLIHPFSPDAAITRMRTHAAHRPLPRALTLGANRIDLQRRLIDGPTGEIPLTELEARLLGFLGARVGQPVRTETILREVWGYTRALQTRAVANAVMRLRRKLEVDPADPAHLLTVRGLGYRLQVAAPAPLTHAG